MNKKRSIALLLVVAMLFTFVSVIAACQSQDECEKNGHTLTAVAKKDATLEEAGYEAYWKCDVCGKMFSDKDGKTEITKPVEIPKLTPEAHTYKHVCPTCGKCTDNTCTDTVCKDKCPGHQTTPTHECKHVCPECGKCMDSTCTDPVCADKCQGHQTEDKKGLTKDNPLTPEEAIALMDEAGSGKVVDPTNKEGYYIQGVVNAGSTIDTQYHEWTFTIGTGAKTVSCKAKIDSTVTNKPTEKNGELDGKTVIIKGFLELYSGNYQCSYLPANISPTGAKFTPNIVDIAVQELPPAEVKSISIKNGSIDYTDKTVYLLPIADNKLSFVATVEPANAPQDIVWTVQNGDKATVETTNGTDEAQAIGPVTYKDQTGTITLTATAKGTNISATVTVEIRDIKGAKESDPLSVDEAIALMEATANEDLFADSCRHGFYIQGTVAEGSTRNAAGTWSFVLFGTNGKSIECSVHGGELNGIQIPNMDSGLDGCEILFYAYALRKNENYTANSNMNELKKCTFPVLTAIDIEAEQTEVTVPYSVEITVKSITPANAIFENVEWLTSDETKATVSGDTAKATVTTIAAGEVKISVKYANVTSNEITLTISEEQAAGKVVYDWSAKITEDIVVDSKYTASTPADMMAKLNTWSPDQQEITAITTTNCKISRSYSGLAYKTLLTDNTAKINLTTLHQIKKVTLKIIPFSDATTTQLSINGVSFSKDKPEDATYDGKLGSAFEAEVELTEVASTLEIQMPWIQNNNFVIIGITLEW